MSRVRVLLAFVLALAMPGLGEAKLHLFKHRRPRVSPGGHYLGQHAGAQKAPKHKAHTRDTEGY